VLGHGKHALPDFLVDWGARDTAFTFVVFALVHSACSYSVSIDFNDNYRGWDDDMIVGSVHFLPFLEAIYWLKRIGYNGWISLDIFPYREDPDLAVTESIAYLKRLDEIVDEIGLDTITELLRKNDGALTLRVINRHVLGTK
jgi:hypothetical protein